jgi:N6-L-threonylcarbamoyladenine synthase
MTLKILGIETSCDETAAAVIQDGRIIRSNVVASQTALHAQYGGVYPEMASRVHAEAIVPVVQQALQESKSDWEDLDAIAVTYGPGLPGSLLVGLNFAKGAALSSGLPLVPVNHLEGHLFALWLKTGEEEDRGQQGSSLERDASSTERSSSTPAQAFPILSLIVSGGHTELILMHDYGQYERLGGTLDDAAGEAFDKVARMLDLGYPGGPAIEATAREGDPDGFDLPRAWLPETLDFSFSGLKTAVMRTLRKQPKPYTPQLVADIAASFQASVVDVLSQKTAQAAEDFGTKAVLIGGGVSANTVLRKEIQARSPVPTYAPPLYLCTDNAAMIAAAGTHRYLAGVRAGWDLDIDPGLQLV